MSKLPPAGATKRAVAAVLCLSLACGAAAARAEDSASGVRSRLDQAIEHEKSRRAGAIAGMAVGGAAIVAGSIVSAVASAQNRDDRDNGQPKSHNQYVGYAVGLGVGLPILGISGYFFADAQHQLNLLRRERLSVSYAPDTHQPVLQLSFNY